MITSKFSFTAGRLLVGGYGNLLQEVFLRVCFSSGENEHFFSYWGDSSLSLTGTKTEK